MANDLIGVFRLIAINPVCISKKNRHFGSAPTDFKCFVRRGFGNASAGNQQAPW